MTGRAATPASDAVRAARDFLLAHAHDYDTVVRDFRWPELAEFNFALEWFDVVAAEHPERPAVKIVDANLNARQWTYGELARRSDQVANWFTELGMKRGDHMIVMLNNTIEIWEILLGLLKVGGVAIPTSTLLTDVDLEARIVRGEATFTIAPAALEAKFDRVPADVVKISVGDTAPDGWVDFADSHEAPLEFTPDGPTPADDTCLLYFTSGTTAQPKLVRHTQVSYPVGHLSTMWWLGVRPGDVHLNISSPGWGKHAWSNFFSPFLAQATVFIFNYARFDAHTLMEIMDTHEVTTFCAPPTVWRMLIQADLTRLHHPPRELVGAGEPLNPEVIAQVRQAWGNTIRDGYGQTEMTCSIGNSPGQKVKDGSMGRPMPGYAVVLLDPVTGEPAPNEGEICLDLSVPNIALMGGYYRDPEFTAETCRRGHYHTGDIASRDADGYLTYVGRADDVFKASDYKISPFELESVLLEHPLIAEAAIVPSPDPLRMAVPKAYVTLAAGATADGVTAKAVFDYCVANLAGYQRIRLLEFVEELPKTISGKIRRVDLRDREAARASSGDLTGQFRYADYR
ncbi:MAG: AMP-binding protein [Micropruina sp.]|nr:MAG: AMP-binding protein [Micropruina sp.]